jgi:hypothetical protein
MDITIIDKKIDSAELTRLVAKYFVDMVKIVVDLRRRRVAVGGELHADAEALLLGEGSHQRDLWGANYYPGVGKQKCIEYTALINIRPSQDNHSMEIEDPEIREAIAEIIFELIGQGEEL